MCCLCSPAQPSVQPLCLRSSPSPQTFTDISVTCTNRRSVSVLQLHTCELPTSEPANRTANCLQLIDRFYVSTVLNDYSASHSERTYSWNLWLVYRDHTGTHRRSGGLQSPRPEGRMRSSGQGAAFPYAVCDVAMTQEGPVTDTSEPLNSR
jgi:hypothetical protein